MEDEERILAYENLFSLEIENYGSHLSNHMEYSGALYDKMLRRRQRIFCHGGDDNHNGFPFGAPKCDSFGAWTMILAEDLTYDAVIRAMERGAMYASTGPRIHEIAVEEDTVLVECSPAKEVILFSGSKAPHFAMAAEGETLTRVSLPLDAVAPYFRVAVIDEKGHTASTRGFFRQEYRG